MLYPFENKKEIYKIDGAVGYELAQLEEYTLVHLTIEKDIPAHAVPLKMTFTVLDGEGECQVGDEAPVVVKKGDVMTVKPGVARAWKSIGDVPLVLLAIRESHSENA